MRVHLRHFTAPAGRAIVVPPGPFSGSPPGREVTSLCAQGRRILPRRLDVSRRRPQSGQNASEDKCAATSGDKFAHHILASARMRAIGRELPLVSTNAGISFRRG
jgi:hypothetical protein